MLYPAACPGTRREYRYPVGRPTRRTPQVEADLVQALRAGNTRKAAAHYAGIGENMLGD